MYKHIQQSIESGIYIMAITLVVGQLIVTNNLASTAHNMREFDATISKVSEKNDQIAQQIASASALQTISEKAQVLGFRLSKTSDFISLGQNEVALLVPLQFESSDIAGGAGQPR